MDLSKDDVLLLIQEYQKHRLLWDSKDKWHYNKKRKNNAWEEIGKALEIDAADAKKKIASCLGSFRREKLKGSKIVETSQGVVKVYKSDWFAFNSLLFLIEKDERKEKNSSDQINIKVNEFHEAEDIDQSPTCSFSTEICPEIPIIESAENMENEIPITSFLKVSTPRKKKVKTTIQDGEKEDPRIQKAYEYLQQSIERQDSTTMYSKYLAEKLKQFHPKTRAVLVHKINRLIFETEMDLY